MKGKKKNKSSPGQLKLPWDDWELKNEEIEKVAEQFIFANCYNPQVAGSILQKSRPKTSETPKQERPDQCQVSKTQPARLRGK